MMKMQQPLTPQPGPPVRLETENYLVRTLTPQHATAEWLQWVSDLEIMQPINTPVARMTLQQLQGYIRSFDRRRAYLFGVFDRKTGAYVGFHQLRVNTFQKTVTFNVLIGDRNYWGKDVVIETRAALLDFFFDERGMEKAIGMPLSRNFPMIYNYRKQGFRLEGTFRGQCLSNYGAERLDQYQFGLLRDEWRKMKAKQPEPTDE
jgi:[ribosomal protein S5]-alanine N-acetyltransferase